MTDGREPDFTRDLIESAFKISEGEMMREKFVLGAAQPPRGARLTAGENFLADVLADPELAGALWHFLPSVLGLKPADRPEEVFTPDDILPWGHTPAGPQPGPGAAVTPEDQGPNCGLNGRFTYKSVGFSEPPAGDGEDLDLVKDFLGRAFVLAAGAAVAGAADLDESYLYTRALDGRPIELTEGESAVQSAARPTPVANHQDYGGALPRLGQRDDFHLDSGLIALPRRAGRVLVLGFVRDPKIMGMNPGLARLRPLRGWLNWEEQVRTVLALAGWLRAQGYLALPSAAGLVLAGHHGVLAGLGELGRQGLLISPDYGPNLRLFTIITDYPFQTGRPRLFGVADYCETCQRCISECPAKALTEGHRRPGLYQWPVNRRACFENWLEKKDPCRKCIEVCPYTREPLVGSPGGAHRPPPL